MTFYFEKTNDQIKGDFKKLPNGKYEAKEIKETRSIQINRYYRILLTHIRKEYENYGYIHIEDFLHELFKKCFLPRKRIGSDFSKKYIYVSGSTTDCNNKQFVEYLNNIKLICEFGKLGEIKGLEEIAGFILPSPNDTSLLNYIDNIGKK